MLFWDLKKTFGKSSARLKSENEWHWNDGQVEKSIITWEQRIVIKEKLKMKIRVVITRALRSNDEKLKYFRGLSP